MILQTVFWMLSFYKFSHYKYHSSQILPPIQYFRNISQTRIFINNTLNHWYTADVILCVSCRCNEKRKVFCHLNCASAFCAMPKNSTFFWPQRANCSLWGLYGVERGSDFTLCWTETRRFPIQSPHRTLKSHLYSYRLSKRLNPLSYFRKSLIAGCTVLVNFYKSNQNVMYYFFFILSWHTVKFYLKIFW